MYKILKKKIKGFTLIELLTVIAIMGILASIIFVLIKPSQRLGEAADVQRQVYARELKNALTQYIFDTAEVPAGMSTTPTPICAQGITDPSCVNIDYIIPTYLTQITRDNLESDVKAIGYTVTVDPDGIVEINSTYLGMGAGGANSSAIAMSSSSVSSVINYAFTNGQLAADLIGQSVNNDGSTPDWTGLDSNDNPNPYGITLYGHTLIDSVNHRLFVSDRDNERVLVFLLDASNQLVDKTPDFVLGQSSPYHSDNSSGQSQLRSPRGLAYDSARQYLFVADSLRVQIFDVSSIVNGEDAIYVLGQSNFTDTLNLSPPTAASMRGAQCLAFDSSNKYLYVGDWVDKRVLIFNTTTLTNGQNAIYVLGQNNFTTGGNTVNSAVGDACITLDQVNKRLFVADSAYNRVMVFDVTTITNGENAVNVLGKPNYTYTSTTTINQNTINQPQGIAYDANNNRLFVSDSRGNRIMVFDTASITNGENAVNVLGQSNFTSSSALIGQSNFINPFSLMYDTSNNRLYLHGSNNRIMIFDVATITNGEAAIDLIGQYIYNDGVAINWTTNEINDAPGPYGLSGNPVGMAVDTIHHRLFIPDTSNARILIYNLDAQNNLIDKMPDYVLGQNDLYTRDVNVATNPNKISPMSVAYDSDNQRLFAADSTSHRVLVYDVNTITPNEAPIYVLGQSNFTNVAYSATQAGLVWPYGLAYDSTTQRLFVSQISRPLPAPAQNGHRISVFDVATITNGEPAINVLGQPDFTTVTSGLTASKLNNPYNIILDEDTQKLYVADSGNRRIVVYDIATITDGEAAINVLGQPNFTTNTLSYGQNGVGTPLAVAYDSINDRLFVSQNGANRVTIFDTATITDNENATTVLGQPDFTSTTGVVTQDGMYGPYGMAYDNTNNTLYVSQGGLSTRVSIFRN